MVFGVLLVKKKLFLILLWLNGVLFVGKGFGVRILVVVLDIIVYIVCYSCFD